MKSKKLRLIADTILTFAARPAPAAPNVRSSCDTTSLTTKEGRR